MQQGGPCGARRVRFRHPWNPLQRIVGVLFQRDILAAANAFVRGHDECRLGVLDTAGEAFGREAAEHHRVNGADARAGEHGVGRLGNHRQVDRDPVALLDAVRLQNVGELAHALMQLAISDLLFLGRIVAFPNDGDLIATRRQMAVNAIGGNVERAVLEPLDRNVAGTERGVLHLRVRLDPVDPAADLAPETLGIGDRPLVKRMIALIVDPGAARPLATRYRMQLPRHRRSPTIIRCWDHYGRARQQRQFGSWADTGLSGVRPRTSR